MQAYLIVLGDGRVPRALQLQQLRCDFGLRRLALAIHGFGDGAQRGDRVHETARNEREG